VNIKLIKLCDAAIGRIAASVIPAPAQKKPQFPVNTLLLIRPGGIGDAALLAPAVRSIKKSYPDCRITILAERRNAGVFRLVTGVDEILGYDRFR